MRISLTGYQYHIEIDLYLVALRKLFEQTVQFILNRFRIYY
jgi:hypothetical protein